MTGTSPNRVGPPNRDAGPPGIPSAACDEEQVAVVPAWLTLPPEIWERIVSFLLPAIRPEHLVFPQPTRRYNPHGIESKLTSHKDLLGLALSCKQLTNIALQALYRAPYLSTLAKVNQFVENMCQNDRGALVPETCQSARWICALHVGGAIDERVIWDKAPKRFCTCDVHVLLHFAENVRYLSLLCTSAALDGWMGDIDCLEDHPMIHFFSTSTKCRPHGLRYSADMNLPRLSLARATSFAPLSRLTHLELVQSAPSQDLTAFLVGTPHLAPSTAIVEEAISAGLSPRSKLQCMRFSETPAETLDEFREFIAFRARPMQPMYFDYVNEAQHALYDLAINSGNLPNLRLLIVEADSVHLVQPLKLLK